MAEGDERRGLYGKYRITKANGEPVAPGAAYFVLRYDNEIDEGAAPADVGGVRRHREASRRALAVYALNCGNEQLAVELLDAVRSHATSPDEFVFIDDALVLVDARRAADDPCFLDDTGRRG